MKQMYCCITVLLLLSSCSNQDTNGRLQKVTIASDIIGVDSLLQVTWEESGKRPSKLLFNIACEGDLEYLADTIIHKDFDRDFAIVSIADYFQEYQLFYIIYDIQNNQLKQTKRFFLPNWNISTFSDIRISGISTDFLSLKTSKGKIKMEKLEPLISNQHKIINYYEFE